VSDDTGIKVPAVNPEQSVAGLAKALSSVAADEGVRDRLAPAAWGRTREHFTWSADHPTRSLGLDFKILAKTIPAVLKGAGAA
jgi:hypothetical protein